MVLMVSELVFQVPCRLPLTHIVSVYSTPGPVCFLCVSAVWCFYQQVPMQTAFSSSNSPHPHQSTCQLAISRVLVAFVCINRLCVVSPLPGSDDWLGQHSDRLGCPSPPIATWLV